ncbi:hypothetical protein Aph02nite_06390 [Actinoplanes philippinensis]|nr:hypothetical protein Aph02nite_06390 [Actinoplanes philippinensis]
MAATPAAAPASASAGSPKPAVSGSAQPRAGWKTIEHRDVRVDIPADWVHPDTGGCEVEYEKWAPAGSPRCTMTTGVVFYGAATFDPAHGPGVRQNRNGDWAGYVFAGDLAVYAIGPDRDLVEDLLGTARPPAPR